MDDIKKAWQRVCMWMGCTPVEEVEIHEDYKTIKKAIEKQIPKKPIVGECDHILEQIEVKCPSCSGMVGINNGEGIDIFFDYCSDCGQKLSKLEV